ncbi:MAG: LON peptidase substrate-binding domain-containing protein [Rhizobiaceae bacterium]
MRAGNFSYVNAQDLPDSVAIFPLSGALLLPGGQMPLNIFEPRYLEMIDAAMRTNRIIAMIQPALDGSENGLCAMGCLGRIVSYTETGDGRYHVALAGICRFRLIEELVVKSPWRQASILPMLSDLEAADGKDVDRNSLLKAFKSYLEANGMEADWESVTRADNGVLVNALSMMSPYGPAEKQALLEAPDLKARAETLVAITEIMLARSSDAGSTLQ